MQVGNCVSVTDEDGSQVMWGVGMDGDGKLVSRGRMGMDTVCVIMEKDGQILHYHAAVCNRAEESADHHH